MNKTASSFLQGAVWYGVVDVCEGGGGVGGDCGYATSGERWLHFREVRVSLAAAHSYIARTMTEGQKLHSNR